MEKKTSLHGNEKLVKICNKEMPSAAGGIDVTNKWERELKIR